MKRQFFYYILIASLLLFVTTACSNAAAPDSGADFDIVVGTDDDDYAPVNENLPDEDDFAELDEPDRPDAPSGGNDDTLSFDPSALYLGKAFADIEKEFPDLEYSGYWAGGEYFSAPSAKKFFVFDSYEINDPAKPNKNAKTTAYCAAAKLIFPGLGSKLSVDDIARITGKDPYVETDTAEGEDIMVSFKDKGYHFWFSNSYDLLPDTLVTVRIE